MEYMKFKLSMGDVFGVETPPPSSEKVGDEKWLSSSPYPEEITNLDLPHVKETQPEAIRRMLSKHKDLWSEHL